MKAHDLITSRAYTVIKAAETFHTKTVRPNEMWQQTSPTSRSSGGAADSFGDCPRQSRRLRCLWTVLDDYSRYIISRKLCTTMCASDATDTLGMALAASGLDHARVLHRPRLLSDNGSSYIASELAEYMGAKNMDHVRGAPFHPQNQGKIER